MADLTELRFKKSYVALTEAIVDTSFQKKTVKALRGEAQDIWDVLSKAQREAFYADVTVLTALSDVGGRAAIDAAGENVSVNALFGAFDPAFRDTLTLIDVIEDDDPVYAYNAASQTAITEADVAAIAGILTTKSKHADFGSRTVPQADMEALRADVAAQFAALDGDVAWLLSMMDVYAAGLAETWDDLSREERREGLYLLKEGELPSKRMFEDVLSAESLAHTIVEAGKAAGVDTSEPISRASFGKAWKKLAGELTDDPLTKAQQKAIKAEGRAMFDEFDTIESIVEAYDHIERMIAVASYDGADFVEEAGEGAVFDFLYRVNTPQDIATSPFFQALDADDEVLAFHPFANVVITENDAKAIAAMAKANKNDATFSADDYKAADVAFFANDFADNFENFQASWAWHMSFVDAFVIALEDAWPTLTKAERQEAIEFPWQSAYIGDALERKIMGVSSFAGMAEVALSSEGVNRDFQETGGSGGGGGGAIDFSDRSFQLAELYASYVAFPSEIFAI